MPRLLPTDGRWWWQLAPPRVQVSEHRGIGASWQMLMRHVFRRESRAVELLASNSWLVHRQVVPPVTYVPRVATCPLTSLLKHTAHCPAHAPQT